MIPAWMRGSTVRRLLEHAKPGKLVSELTAGEPQTYGVQGYERALTIVQGVALPGLVCRLGRIAQRPNGRVGLFGHHPRRGRGEAARARAPGRLAGEQPGVDGGLRPRVSSTNTAGCCGHSRAIRTKSGRFRCVPASGVTSLDLGPARDERPHDERHRPTPPTGQRPSATDFSTLPTWCCPSGGSTSCWWPSCPKTRASRGLRANRPINRPGSAGHHRRAVGAAAGPSSSWMSARPGGTHAHGIRSRRWPGRPVTKCWRRWPTKSDTSQRGRFNRPRRTKASAFRSARPSLTRRSAPAPPVAPAEEPVPFEGHDARWLRVALHAGYRIRQVAGEWLPCIGWIHSDLYGLSVEYRYQRGPRRRTATAGRRAACPT